MRARRALAVLSACIQRPMDPVPAVKHLDIQGVAEHAADSLPNTWEWLMDPGRPRGYDALVPAVQRGNEGGEHNATPVSDVARNLPPCTQKRSRATRAEERARRVALVTLPEPGRTQHGRQPALYTRQGTHWVGQRDPDDFVYSHALLEPAPDEFCRSGLPEWAQRIYHSSLTSTRITSIIAMRRIGVHGVRTRRNKKRGTLGEVPAGDLPLPQIQALVEWAPDTVLEQHVERWTDQVVARTSEGRTTAGSESQGKGDRRLLRTQVRSNTGAQP